MEGWIKLHRKMLDSDIWISDEFSRGQAWVDLILLANHKDSYFIKRGNRVDVKRGQIGHSVKALSNRWKWSSGKVNRFLKLLENENQILIKKNNVTTVLTVINYNDYQQDGNQTKTKRKPNENQTETYKNEKNEKNDICINSFDLVLEDSEKSKYEPVIKTSYNDFMMKFKQNCPTLLKIPKQLNIDSYYQLVNEYGKDKLGLELEKLDLWVEEKGVKRKDVNLSIKRWLKNDY